MSRYLHNAFSSIGSGFHCPVLATVMPAGDACCMSLALQVIEVVKEALVLWPPCAADWPIVIRVPSASAFWVYHTQLCETISPSISPFTMHYSNAHMYS